MPRTMASRWKVHSSFDTVPTKLWLLPTLTNTSTTTGYYTHLHVPTDRSKPDNPPLTLVIITCEVKTAIDPEKRIMVYVLYAPHHDLPHSGSTSEVEKGFVREMTAPNWVLTQSRSETSSSKNGVQVGTVEPWSVEVPGIGYMKVDAHGDQEILVRMPANQDHQDELILTVRTSHRTPYSSLSPISGPEGPFERLGIFLPLHWHVFSGCSKAEWSLATRPKSEAWDPLRDMKTGFGPTLASGTAMAHVEKNHGVGFPSGWIWAHCLGSNHTFSGEYERPPIRLALAGGSILGLEAYLIGFRDDSLGIEWDFTPPGTVGLNGWGTGAGMKVERMWDAHDENEGVRQVGKVRRVRVQAWTLGRWLDIEIVASAVRPLLFPGLITSST